MNIHSGCNFFKCNLPQKWKKDRLMKLQSFNHILIKDNILINKKVSVKIISISIYISVNQVTKHKVGSYKKYCSDLLKESTVVGEYFMLRKKK